MTPTKVQIENEKIAAAMKGRAAARQRSRTVKTPEQIIAQAQADGILEDAEDQRIPDPDEGMDPADPDNTAGSFDLEGTVSRPMTAKERAVSGRKATPAPKPSATKSSRKPKTKAQTDAEKRRRSLAAEKSRKAAQAKAAKTPKTPRVLPDPVDNARLIRMRAKWTAIRRERDVARLEEAQESNPTPQVAADLQVAKAEYEVAVQAERDAYAAYRVLLEGRKAAPAETASTVAETAEGAE